MERTGIDPTEHSLPLAEIIKNYDKLTIAVSGGGGFDDAWEFRPPSSGPSTGEAGPCAFSGGTEGGNFES